eukprot:scaffold53_cov381-Pavlova_lutheri.AAC.25
MDRSISLFSETGTPKGLLFVTLKISGGQPYDLLQISPKRNDQTPSQYMIHDVHPPVGWSGTAEEKAWARGWLEDMLPT